MERKHSARLPTVVVLGALVLAVSACGEDDDHENELRPPAPINVTAYVSPERVSVSPSSFGAGPIVVVVTNQSNSSQEVTFASESAGTSGRGDVTTSTEINPGNTGQLKLDVQPGSYLVRTGDEAVRPASVTVGPKRETSQNQVLLP